MMRVRLMRLWQPGAVVMAVNKAMVIHQCRVRVPFLPLRTLRFSQCKGSRLHSTGGGGGKARPISLQTMVEEGEKMNHSSNPFGILIKEVEGELGSPLGSSPQASPSKPLIIVISGPSGVGKDAVIKKLQEIRKEIHFVVTATTRSMRPGEVEGKDYFFVSKKEFQSMIDNEELLEHAIVYGENKGIPKQQVRDCIAKGVDVVLRVDVQGAATVKSILGSSAVFIFLVAESEFALVQRLVERKTESMERLLVRVRTAREEMKRLDEFDYVVVNADGQLERSVSLISSIIDAEKSRVHQRTAHV